MLRSKPLGWRFCHSATELHNRRSETMTLTGISNRGLLVIAFLVTILWGCIVVEHAIINEARRQTVEQLRSRQLVPARYENRDRPRLLPLPRASFAG